MKIFENGLLVNRFLNPNYRGLVGWEVQELLSVRKLIAIKNGGDTFVFENGYNNSTSCVHKIRKFTLEEIPVGELVWVQDTEHDEIELKPFEVFMPSNCSIIVPYLIADTEEKAVELRDWNKK